jgi:hypothetical protein
LVAGALDVTGASAAGFSLVLQAAIKVEAAVAPTPIRASLRSASRLEN